MAHERDRIYRFGDFTLEVGEHRLRRDDEEIPLQPKTFDMLLYMAERHGHLVPKRELLDALWGDALVTEGALTRCIREVRKALEDDASHPSYIRTIPRVGYKFIAQVEEVRSAAEEEETVEEEYTAMRVMVSEEVEETAVGCEHSEVVDHGPELAKSRPGVTTKPSVPRITVTSRARKLTPQVLMATVALVGLALIIYYSQPNRPEPTPPIKSIAVLPFKPLVAANRDQVLELGLADTLITRLSTLKHVIVRPTSAVRQYTDLEQDPLAAGRELKVEAVLEGSLQRVGDQLRVTVRLLSVPDGASLWAYQCDERQCTDIFAVQDAISQEVAQALRLTLTGEEKQRLIKHYTENTEAYQLYLKGRYFWNKFTVEDFWKSIEYFQQAIEKDPGYALAYAGLADAYRVLAALSTLPPKEAYSRVKAAVAKALDMDDGLAEAHVALGWCRLEYDWDWPAAEKEFQRAIELNPNITQLYAGYAYTLAALGRLDEAQAEIERVLELDPVSLIINTDLGIILYYGRQYDLAIEQFRQTIEMDPDFPLAHHWLGRAYEKKAMYEDAVTERLKFRTLAHRAPPRIVATLKEAYAVSGWTGFCQKNLDLQLEARSNGRYIQPLWIAESYLCLGQKDQVIKWVREAYDERYGMLVYLNVDPFFDSLRSDPRFQDLLRRIGERKR